MMKQKKNCALVNMDIFFVLNKSRSCCEGCFLSVVESFLFQELIDTQLGSEVYIQSSCTWKYWAFNDFLLFRWQNDCTIYIFSVYLFTRGKRIWSIRVFLKSKRYIQGQKYTYRQHTESLVKCPLSSFTFKKPLSFWQKSA